MGLLVSGRVADFSFGVSSPADTTRRSESGDDSIVDGPFSICNGAADTECDGSGDAGGVMAAACIAGTGVPITNLSSVSVETAER
mmetsp:Transcript_68688/g.166109  ORF Transcript_68688/g.166109 Transcript_68688/m.166109 type:complete len:85 (-) Transcript_68688:80-334(-)